MRVKLNNKEITNPNKENKFGIIFGLAFLLPGLGVMVLVLSILLYSINLTFNGRVAPGIVSEIERVGKNKRYYFEYTNTPGKTYKLTSGVNSDMINYYEGQPIEVRYIPGQEDRGRVNNFSGMWLTPIALSFFGIIFSLIGGGITGFYIKDSQKRKFLAAQGKSITADVSTVDFVNEEKGRDYWVIRAQWHDSMTNTLYAFDSDMLYINPAAYVKDKVTVLIDPKNPKRYLVDLSFMPKLGN